ncbi:unnamed protein product, partial [Ectocarpus sp. 13 AM-2016]
TRQRVPGSGNCRPVPVPPVLKSSIWFDIRCSNHLRAPPNIDTRSPTGAQPYFVFASITRYWSFLRSSIAEGFVVSNERSCFLLPKGIISQLKSSAFLGRSRGTDEPPLNAFCPA